MSENIIEEIRGRFYKSSIVIHDDALGELERKLATAIQERDEARRMFCHEIAESGKLEHEYDENARLVAESFDWDCFKEVQP